MKLNFLNMLNSGLQIAVVFGATVVFGEPKHGIAMYGEPALPPDFVSLPYANPDAATGGVFIDGQVDSFDSLNPHIRKGRVPWQLRFLAYESLMARSYDEPFTLYGLLAESLEVDPEHKWVEFTLRPEARFSDGSPVTAEDVIWSYEILGTEGHPRYASSWTKIEKAEITGERKVRFTFKEADRELALIMGMRPILKKNQWQGKNFAESGLDVIPITTAAYVIDDFQAGRFVSLKRNPDYWGKDLPLRKGFHVIDEIRMEFFRDATAMQEAFKAGNLSMMRETNAANWAQNYSFPKVESGEILKSEIAHKRPTGMKGFVMNTRRDDLKDWRVREALIQLFNFEFISDKVGGGLPRIKSYFHNSFLGMEPGEASGKTAELLLPFKDDLLPGTLEGYEFPVTDGKERNRKGLRKALVLLEEAGWTVQDGVLKDKDGTPFKLEILLEQGGRYPEDQPVSNIFVEALEKIGITAKITSIDSAQYKERTDNHDFDIAYNLFGLSLSPGNEQTLYWGSDSKDTVGSKNWIGLASPAVDQMIDTMLTSQSAEDYQAAVKALDRLLTAGRYVIPVWYSNVSFVAHDARLKRPDTVPIYGDYLDYLPDVWWFDQK